MISVAYLTQLVPHIVVKIIYSKNKTFHVKEHC